MPGKRPIAVAPVRTHLPRLARACPGPAVRRDGNGQGVRGAGHPPAEPEPGFVRGTQRLRAHRRGAARPLASGSAGGTLYLSDVHAFDREAQDALWEWLTRHAGRRRLIVGTDRDLAERAATGAFRADLLARLAVNTLRLPPLRHRLGALPEIAGLLLYEAEGPGRKLAPEGLSNTCKPHLFPGNLGLS